MHRMSVVKSLGDDDDDDAVDKSSLQRSTECEVDPQRVQRTAFEDGLFRQSREWWPNLLHRKQLMLGH